MKLPKNPTEAQILAVTGLVIKSIYTRGTVAVQTLDLDSQGRLTGIFLGDGVRFRYTIDNGILSYAPVNPKDLPSEEGISLSEDALDFARLKIAGNTKQEKKCKVGYACGYSCISQSKVCNKALPGQAKNGAEWVKMQREKESPTGYKGLVQRAEQKFAKELKAIDDAIAEVERQVKPLQKEKDRAAAEQHALNARIVKLRDRKLSPEEELEYMDLLVERDTLWDQMFKIDERIEQINNSSKVIARVEDLRQKLLTDADQGQARVNVKNIELGEDRHLQPYNRAFYTAELEKLYAATNNQVSTLNVVDIFGDSKGGIHTVGFAINPDDAEGVGMINVGQYPNKGEQTRALWHEFGHHLEYSNPAYKEAAVEWRQSRADTDKPVQMAGREPGQVALPGRYIDEYVGRVYKHGSTEVISMGLQNFSHPRMLTDFYRQDREHFLLILGMLR